MSGYIPRIVDEQIEHLLKLSGALNLVGLRACGKTTTAKKFAQSVLQLDESDEATLEGVNLAPEAFLPGRNPRLLDEWQLVPKLWSAVRRQVDQDNTPGQFLLSGSAWPLPEQRRHSGAGRIHSLPIRTMSLFESGDSNGSVSLRSLVEDIPMEPQQSDHELGDIAGLTVRGGWPAWIRHSPDNAQELLEGYLENLSLHGFPLVGGQRRAPDRFKSFIRAYATLTAHPAPLSTVAKRLSDEGINVGKDYPGLFHEFAKRMFLVEDQPAWSVQPRSKTALVATPKRHLCDPALAAAALRLSDKGLLKDPETFGFLFESLVVRDLRIYSQPLRGTVHHYRSHDSKDEMDAVVSFPDRKWIGVEVKLNLQQGRRAADRLVELAQKFENPPQALLVIVGSGPAVKLPNGVWIVPIGALGP